MAVRCVLFVETDRQRRWLRRYSFDTSHPDEQHFHHAQVAIEDGPIIWDGEGSDRSYAWLDPHEPQFCLDQRWLEVRRCECGYEFTRRDKFQILTRSIWVDGQTGVERTQDEMPPGSVFDAWWYPWKGNDGRSLVVITPDGHQWGVDGRANNCDSPEDLTHRCWIRHGDPPDITVDKNGHTCTAGAGSILTSSWHGFLRRGWLVEVNEEVPS